ncbi:hypothetical protein C1646_768426 [Rhizophagus diaphanus]|nr:hypothetical protein C1646_768426 [Rhizophagus diaphanus] [Rhizophagus sp. MUCL 43196]
MYTFVNFFSQSFYQSNQTNPIPTPPPSPTTSSTLHEYMVCKASYRKAINEFKAQLVHVIQVFEGYIHYYNYQTGSYKYFFQGPDAYTQVANLFNNPNWERKFFNNNQQTFVVLFDAQAEADANQESLSDQHSDRIPKNRLKRFNLPKLTVEWKYKKSKEDAKNNRTSAEYINLKFCAQQI